MLPYLQSMGNTDDINSGGIPYAAIETEEADCQYDNVPKIIKYFYRTINNCAI